MMCLPGITPVESDGLFARYDTSGKCDVFSRYDTSGKCDDVFSRYDTTGRGLSAGGCVAALQRNHPPLSM